MDAARGSHKDLGMLCGLMHGAPDDDYLPFLPVFYSALDGSDISILDGTELPLDALNRLFVAVEGLRFIRNIPEEALEELWPRAWHAIQILELARDWLPNDASHIRLTLLRTIELFQNREGKGPTESTDGVCVLVAQIWAELLERPDPLDDDFFKLCRFVGRADVSSH